MVAGRLQGNMKLGWIISIIWRGAKIMGEIDKEGNG